MNSVIKKSIFCLIVIIIVGALIVPILQTNIYNSMSAYHSLLVSGIRLFVDNNGSVPESIDQLQDISSKKILYYPDAWQSNDQVLLCSQIPGSINRYFIRKYMVTWGDGRRSILSYKELSEKVRNDVDFTW